MIPSRTLRLVAMVAPVLAGCELSLTPSISPTVDTAGKVGFETRGDFRWGTGEYGRIQQTIGAGFGYHQDQGMYGVIVTGLGIELDYHREDPPMLATLAWGGGAHFGAEGSEFSGRLIMELFGLVTQTERTKEGEGKHLFFLGPQLQVGVLSTDDEAGDPEARGWFALGLALHWSPVGQRHAPRAPQSQPVVPVVRPEAIQDE